MRLLTCHDIGSIAGQPNRREPAQDARAFVRFPEPMQEHMLGNMRDHLVTLNEIIGNVADGEYDATAKLVEQKLG